MSTELSTPQNFDLQTIVNLIGSNAQSVSELTQQMGLFNNRLSSVESNVSSTKNDVENIKFDIQEIKYNAEITTEQCCKITDTAKKRVYEILGDDPNERAKYFGSFIRRCYADAAQYAGLAKKISRTRCGDYQRVINYIEAWTPRDGISETKRQADINAKAYLNAKAKGYYGNRANTYYYSNNN